MLERKRRDVSRAAIGSLLLLGAYVGCYPDFDGLSSGSKSGSSGTGTGGAMAGSAGAGGATGGMADDGGEGGESPGVGGTGTSGTGTGGKGGSGTGKGGKGGDGGESGDEGGTGTGGTSMAGKGGVGGAGGTMVSGGAGAGGASAGGGAGGAAGAGGAGGQAGGCTEGGSVTASGVEVLSVPLMTVGEGQRFNVQNRTNPPMPFDMSGATLTIRAYAPCAIGGNLSIFFRSTSGTDSPSMKVGLSTLVDAFVDIVVPVPVVTGYFDPTLVDIIRIEVEADAAFGSTFRSPATIVYIDSVSSSNGAVMHPFDTMPTFLDFGDSGFRPLPGSTNTWRAQYP